MATRAGAAAAAAAATGGSKRKRRSAPATPTESPAKRHTTRGGAGSAAAAAADPPTLVPVEGEWSKPMRPAREDGKFIDVTLLVGGREIPTHRLVLVSHSPYLDGLLTSGLAESREGGDTLKLDDTTDGRAVEAIVDCFYSGQLSISRSNVSSVIRTANLFRVDAAEKAACDFFVEALEPSTGCEALAFAAAHSVGGEHARGLHERCVEYVVDHFAECCAEASFLELSCEAVAEVVGSDDLPEEESVVLHAVRAWFDHDAAGRAGSLKVLLPLVRWPLLPVAAQLKFPQEPLLVRMMRQDDVSCTLGIQLLTECRAEFAASDAAAACSRLKQRKGTVLPVAFTALSHEHYDLSEDGALVKSTGDPFFRAALCRERVMNSGRSCAEVTVVEAGGGMMIGVGRPALDPSTDFAYTTADFWGLGGGTGVLFHNDNGGQHWQGMQGCGTGDVLRLLLDSDAGTLTVKKNGTLLGVAVTSGLTGDLCWAVAMSPVEDGGSSVRIKAVHPAEF